MLFWLFCVFVCFIIFESCTFNSIANFFAHFRKLDLFLKNFDKILNDDIFIELYMFHEQTNFSLIVNRFYDVWNCIDVVFCMTRKNHEILCFSEIFRDHHFLKTQFLFYFLIICYEIHVKLIHINFRWIETIIYRVILSEMFVCNFLIHVSCLDSVEMFQWFIFRNFRSVCMLKYNEMFCFICNRRMFRVFFNCCSHVQI